MLILDELINLHRGQGMDLFWRDSLTCPTEEEYVEMVNNKTGGLLRLAVKLMQACSSSDMYSPLPYTKLTTCSDYVPLVNLIGILFQIRDDYQNLQDTQYTNNKGLCEDITEGKFSFPIIHAILSRPDDRQLISTYLPRLVRRKY
jgi:geranylgeranyl diphosphate synthase type 3